MTDSSPAVPGPGQSEPAAFRRYSCSVLRCRAYFERVLLAALWSWALLLRAARTQPDTCTCGAAGPGFCRRGRWALSDAWGIFFLLKNPFEIRAFFFNCVYIFNTAWGKIWLASMRIILSCSSVKLKVISNSSFPPSYHIFLEKKKKRQKGFFF